MTPFGRALIGASLGAVITLCLHPVSRPYMLGLGLRASPEALSKCIDSHSAEVSEPKSLDQASLWMQLASTRIRDFDHLSAREHSTLLSIANVAGAHDVPNAFWLQMKAVLYDDMGDRQSAIKSWLDASRCIQWDDYQAKRLDTARNSLIAISGEKKAWQLAYLYSSRSDDFALDLERMVKHLLARAPFETEDGLKIRYATLLNGDLVRRFAKSTRTNVTAMNITELAAFPSAFVDTNSPKRLWAGEISLIANLGKLLHAPDKAAHAKEIFSTSESYRALSVRDSNEQIVALTAAGSVVTGSLASATLALAFLGLLIYFAGYLVDWRLSNDKEIKWYIAAPIALSLGALAYSLTMYWPAALTLALCSAFLTVAPNRSRRIRPTDFGPLLPFTIILLCIVCGITFGAYLVGSTSYARLILPSLGVPSDYVERPIIAGLATLTFGLVLLTAPLWAIVHRVGTPYVLSIVLRRFGSFMGACGLFLSVILGPVSVYAERYLETTQFELLNKEPVHFYIQQ